MSIEPSQAAGSEFAEYADGRGAGDAGGGGRDPG